MLLNYELTTHLENDALWCHSRYRILSSWIGGFSTGEATPLSEIKIFNTRPFNAVVLQPEVLSASSRCDSDEQKWLKRHFDMLKHESSSWPSQPLLQQQWKVISWGWEMWKGKFGNSMKFLDTWQKVLVSPYGWELHEFFNGIKNDVNIYGSCFLDIFNQRVLFSILIKMLWYPSQAQRSWKKKRNWNDIKIETALASEGIFDKCQLLIPLILNQKSLKDNTVSNLWP